MDGEGSDFTFSQATEYLKGQDANDISWADIFLDGIHSDDPISSESGGIRTNASNLGASIHAGTQQIHHQSQSGMMGGQLQIHIPAQLQGSITNNAVQQGGTKLCGTVAYLAPSASTHQYVNAAGGIHNVMTVSGHHQMAASVGQQQQQNNTKLVHITPSFPVTQLSNSVPIQTLLQPNQTLTGQTLYGGQGPGMFPTQGSVHIENPKVVNVNFGPHVIGSDGSGQQAIIQSIRLTQPLVGTQLINTTGGNVIRTNLAQGTHTIMPSTANQPRHIVLPSGQTVISQQTSNPHGGIAKNVVLRSLNSNMSPVIYQSGQGGQLIHSQPTLISGPGLQVVNAGGGQGNQVQLITQPSINQTGMGQQQGSVMNLINNSGVLPGTGNQITGLVPGQNIFVNGQVLSFGQLRSLTVPQLHVQRNSQGGLTLADINAAVTCSTQFQPTAPQLVIQQNGQQQQFVLQPKSNSSPSLMASTVPSQRLISGMQGNKSARTPTPNASSASSTPVMTPTPSTPTPTPTPELMSDFPGGKGNQGMNILKQALDMSDIDLQSFEDDISFLDSSADCFSMLTAQSPTQTSALPSLKPVSKLPKFKPKTVKTKLKNAQVMENVTNNSTLQFQQVAGQFQTTSEQTITHNPQQKFITPNGQVYVLSANSQQLILQPPVSSPSPLAAEYKPATSLAATSVDRTQVPSGFHLQIKGLHQQGVKQGLSNSSLNHQLKLEPHNISVLSEDKSILRTSDSDSKFFIKTCPDEDGTYQIETSMSSFPGTQTVYTTGAGYSSSPAMSSQTSSHFNQMQIQHIKNQNVLSGGTYARQTPVTSMIKQETVTDLDQSISHTQASPNMAAPMGISNSPLSIPTSSFGAVTTPIVISSPSFTAIVTTTTQSHQTTIMSTSHMSVSNAGTYTSHSSTLGDISVSTANMDYQSQNMEFFHGVNSTVASTSAKSNTKEKDPTNVKAMIPIKIADSTLMLSLTPVQKERLESQIARMSKKDQEGFLVHQQNVIRRSLQMQQKQQQKQLSNLPQQQQAQEFQQHTSQDEIQQFQPPQNQTQQVPQQQVYQQSQLSAQQETHESSPLEESYYPEVSEIHSAQVNSRAGLLSPQAVQTPPTLPTTVQELIEMPGEKEAPMSFQPFSALKPQEQSQHHIYSQPVQQTELQQHMYSNLHQRTAPLTSSGSASIQQFVVPQIGRCLAEQQLLRDRSLAVDPDVNNPFKSLSDAMRRLVRYHTLQDHKPEEGSKTMRIWDSRYSKLCDYLVKKKRCYSRRFNKMKLYQDMCPGKQPEYIQNLICFNEQLRALIKSEKEGAVNQPDLVDTVMPISSPSSWSATSVTSKTDVLYMQTPADCSIEKRSVNVCKLKDLAVIKNSSPDPESGSQKSEFSRKRKSPDKGSSGMLKLVFKRRTTDNFFVRNSLASGSVLPRDLRPVVNLDRSDSEYEFDSNAADVSCNQPVIVRRRTLSVTSRQASCDVVSDNGSVSSHVEEMQNHSSSEEEEDVEEESDDEDIGDGGKSFGDDGDNYGTNEFVEDKRPPKRRYHVSFGDEVHNSEHDSSSDASESASSDAFMAVGEIVLESPHHLRKVSATDSSVHSYMCADENSSDIENLNSDSKPSHHQSHTASVTSHDVFHAGLPYSHPGCSLSNSDHSSTFNTFSVGKSVGRCKFSFDARENDAPGSFTQSSQVPLLTPKEEYVPESPVNSLEVEAARKGLPNCSIFTTPNKSLLKTDDMFNSEDEDEVRGSTRMVSKFEIDNKDPQSSMIDDSVRSVINSVLNNSGEDDEDDNKGSQTSWTSSTSGHRNLFQPYASIMIPPGHNDLDLAVQSILNS